MITVIKSGTSDNDIFQINLDNPKQVVNVTNDSSNVNAQLARSPDGRWVVFASIRDGHSQLFVGSADGKQPIRSITASDSGNAQLPVWGAQNLIAYEHSTGGQVAIFTIDPKVGTIAQVSTAGVTAMHPTWSPDGKTLAYVAYTGTSDSSKIMLFAVTSGKTVQLTTSDVGQIQSLSWSPAGNRIALVSVKNQQTDLVTINTADSTAKQLTNDGAVETGLVWSPDGVTLAYLSVVNSAAQVFAVNTSSATPKPVIVSKTVEYPAFDLGWDCNGRLVYTAPNGTGSNVGLYLVGINNGATPKLLTDPALSVSALSGVTSAVFSSQP